VIGRTTRPILPPRSETEVMTEKAERAFGYRINSLSYQKSSISNIRSQKTMACTGTTASRPVNAGQGVSLPENSADSTRCRMMTTQLEHEEQAFRQMVDAVEIDAKRMGIYPGVIRDLYTRHGFNPY
jgi:hypothetical protein